MRGAVRRGRKKAPSGQAQPQRRQADKGGRSRSGHKAALRPVNRALPSDSPSHSLPLSDARPSVAPRESHQCNVCHWCTIFNFFFFSGIKRLRRVGWDSGPGKMPG